MPFEDTDQAKSHLVRLFPTVRINSVGEAELRATAAFLAMVSAVSEFGRVVVKVAGGPAGIPRCYTEVPYTDQDQEKPVELRPDGLLVVNRNGKTWRAFLEVKVGSNPIEKQQIENYLKLAKQEQVDAIITISHEAAVSGGLPPIGIPKGKLKRVSLVHLSWERLLSEAKVLCNKDGIRDSDQKWMLDEWIRYVADPSARIMDPPTLGGQFGEVLQAAKAGTLEAVTPALLDVCSHWDGYMKKAALQLRAKLAVDVEPRQTRAERDDHALRVKNIQTVATSKGRLTGKLKIKNTAADVCLSVILASRSVQFTMTIDAPSEGRKQTRLNWMTRQLAHAPSDAIINVYWSKRGLQSRCTIAELKSPHCLSRDTHGQPIPSGELPRWFSVEWTQDLQRGRGKSTVRTLEGITQNLECFYKDVAQRLTAYVPKAPKLMVETTSSPQVVPKPTLAIVKVEKSPASDKSNVVQLNQPGTRPSSPPPAAANG